MPTLSACPGEATYGGPLEKPTGATLIPGSKFGKVMVTDPPNPLTGVIDTISSAPPPSCCRAMEVGEMERLKSWGGGLGLPELPPQPAKPVINTAKSNSRRPRDTAHFR
jgi:hypothetical protein